MQKTYRRQYQQVHDLIKKVTGGQSSDIDARVMSSVSSESASTSNISQAIQQAMANIAPPRIIEGFDVVATDPSGIQIEVNTDTDTGKSIGVACGKYIETTQSFTFDLSAYLGLGAKVLYVNVLSSDFTPRVSEVKDSQSLVIAKIIIPDETTIRILDDKPDAGSDGYIISGRDLLFEDNFVIDDYTIELFREKFSKIAADNIIEGSIVASEHLKVTNVSGSAELGSDALDFYDSSGDHLAHYGADNAWIGQILITDSTFQSKNYSSGISGFCIDKTGDAEFNNVKVRGELHSAVFVYDETHALNGYLVVSNASTLSKPIDTSTTTISVKDDVFSDGDIFRMKDATNSEYVKVTSGGGTTTLTVTRDFDGSGANSWDEGTAIVSVDSRIEINSSGQSGEPNISIIERTGFTTYDQEELRVKLGNLNGYLEYSSDIYGIGIGSSSANQANMTFDATNGIRMRSGTTDLIVFDNSGNAYLAGALTIGGASGVLASSVNGWAHASDTTLIDGGDIYTGTVTATQIAANTITASEIKGTDFGTLTISSGKIAINTTDALEIQASGNMKVLAGGDIIMIASTTNPALINWGDAYYLGCSATASVGLCIYPETINQGAFQVGYDPVAVSEKSLYNISGYAYNNIDWYVQYDINHNSRIKASATSTSGVVSLRAEDNGILTQLDLDGTNILFKIGSGAGSDILTLGGSENVTHVLFRSDNHKVDNLGGPLKAWDTAYADDFTNVADFYNFDDKDDLAAINQIQGSGVIESYTGYELIDDNTIPDWLIKKHKRDGEIKDEDGNLITSYKQGDNCYDPDGKPYLSLKTMISLLMGAVRELDSKIATLESRSN